MLRTWKKRKETITKRSAQAPHYNDCCGWPGKISSKSFISLNLRKGSSIIKSTVKTRLIWPVHYACVPLHAHFYVCVHALSTCPATQCNFSQPRSSRKSTQINLSWNSFHFLFRVGMTSVFMARPRSLPHTSTSWQMKGWFLTAITCHLSVPLQGRHWWLASILSN